MRELHRPVIAVLASGGGSTLEAVVHATQDGRVDVEVGLVVCDKPPEVAGVYGRIERLNERYGLDINVVHLSGKTHPKGKAERGQTDEESAAICELVNRGGFAHVALMGYMRMVRGTLLEEYGWLPNHTSIYQAGMTNTHPGPLPETQDKYGIHVSQKVLDLRLAASKHTVHVVAAAIDEGPIVAEHPVEILGDDTAETLFGRVQIVEKATLPYALGNFLREQRDFNANS